MCIPSSPYHPPHSLSLKIAATPPTHQPFIFTSEPIIDLNELMTSAATPAVTFIPPELPEPPQQQQNHAHSDCGHYGSPTQLNRSHSLLRNFSVRSRNTLRKRKHQGHRPPPSLSVSRPGIVRTHSTSTTSASSLSSIWKKWVKGVTNLTGHDEELDAISAVSCPQGPARKRNIFLPVGRLVAPFQIPSTTLPPSDDSTCIIIPQSSIIGQDSRRLLSSLGAIQDEDDKKVNGSSNPSFSDAGDIVELIRQVPESQKTESELKSTDMLSPLPSPSRTPPPLTSLDSSPSNSPPLLTPSSINSPLSSSPLFQTPCSTPLPLPSSSSPSPPLPDFQPVSHPPSSQSPDNMPPSSVHESNSQSSSNSNLKLSISQRRRAKFTLGDGSDLDCDSLAVSAPRPVAEPNVLSNDSTQPGSRDQLGTASESSPDTATATTTKLTRRWTLSSALTDEGISDEGLAKELEKMREVVEWDCSPIDKDGQGLPSSSSPPPSPSNPCSPWLITQRALLTTRELILTERHYLSSLLLLLSPDSTLTPVPEMMVSHAKELIDVSKRLLEGMEGEPSARGVAEVFVEVGGGLSVDAESAFVGWCGAVGGWFQDDLADTQAAVGVKRKRKGCESVGGSGEYQLMISEHESSGPGSVTFPTTTGEHAPHTSPLKRTVSTWRKSMPSVPGLGEGGVWRRDKDKDRSMDKDKDEGGSTYGRARSAFDEDRSPPPMPMTLTGKPPRRHAVRDLAILPTQRVTRYVLLYRELLAYTPPSCSTYPIVERAVEAACRIAEKCNRAQGNAAFAAGAARDSSSSTLILNNCSISRRRLFSGKRVMTVPEPINLKPKSGYGSTKQSSSPTSSPTKSHFILSSSPPSSPSTSSFISPTPSSISRPASPTRNRSATNPLPPPPSSFNSKIPVANSRQQSFSSSTLAGSSSTTSTTISTFSSSSSSSSSSFPSLPLSPFQLVLPKPKSTTSSSLNNLSSRVPKSLSFMSMSLANGLGRNVSAAVDGTTIGGDSAPPTKGYASAIPTKIKV